VAPKPSILVVETDPREAELIVLVLGENDLGEQVRLARSVDDAVDILQAVEETFTPRLIVIGIAHHGERELELARRLRTDWRTRTIPIIVVSSASPPERSDWNSLGISSFVLRPVDFEKLLEAAGSLSLWWRAQARGATLTAP
jgi:two-component system phosphate regulon response regulator PhoB